MAGNRVLLQSVKATVATNEEVTIEVILKCNQTIYVGTITSPDTEQDRLIAATHATVAALNQLIQNSSKDQTVKINLLDYRTIMLAHINKAVFLVIIEFIDKDEKTLISGSSIAQIENLSIEAEAIYSVAKATLNATNRRLSRYI
jgi:hypothetical protein